MPRGRKNCTLCNEEPIHHKSAELCRKCYGFLYYWRDRTPTQMMQRMRTLQRWTNRMNNAMRGRIKRVA